MILIPLREVKIISTYGMSNKSCPIFIVYVLRSTHYIYKWIRILGHTVFNRKFVTIYISNHVIREPWSGVNKPGAPISRVLPGFIPR